MDMAKGIMEINIINTALKEADIIRNNRNINVIKIHAPRSTQGLAGGVVGSVLGYQLGNGNPVATGVGAAAGSYLGNGMSGR